MNWREKKGEEGRRREKKGEEGIKRKRRRNLGGESLGVSEGCGYFFGKDMDKRWDVGENKPVHHLCEVLSWLFFSS